MRVRSLRAAPVPRQSTHLIGIDMLTPNQQTSTDLDIFDAAAVANELEDVARGHAGNERELRLAVSRHLKTALTRGRAAAEQLLIKERRGRRCAERLSDMQDEISACSTSSWGSTSIPCKIPRKPSAWRSSPPAATAAA